MMSLNYALKNVSCTVVVLLIFLETVSQDCSYRNSFLSNLLIAVRYRGSTFRPFVRQQFASSKILLKCSSLNL